MCEINEKHTLLDYLNDCETDFKKFIDCRREYEKILIDNGYG